MRFVYRLYILSTQMTWTVVGSGDDVDPADPADLTGLTDDLMAQLTLSDRWLS